MRAQTGEARSADYLLQRLSAAVQRGNAISEGARDITVCSVVFHFIFRM